MQQRLHRNIPFVSLCKAVFITALCLIGSGCGQRGGQQTQLTPESQTTLTPPVAPPPAGVTEPPVTVPQPPHSPAPDTPSPVVPKPPGIEPVPPPSAPDPQVPSPPLDPGPPVSPPHTDPVAPGSGTPPPSTGTPDQPDDATPPNEPVAEEPPVTVPPVVKQPTEPDPEPTPEPDSGIKPATTIVIEGPHQSERVQAALDNLNPGDTLILRAGDGVYRSHALAPGQTLRGFTLRRSGTPQAPIRILGEAAAGFKRPVIDQGRVYNPQATSDELSGEPVVGLYLPCVSHVQVENLEIRMAQEAGISTALGGCRGENLQILNNYIHQIYGRGWVGAIRAWGTSDLLIQGNVLADIVHTAPGAELPAIPAASSEQPAQDIRIEHNDLAAAPSGVQLLALDRGTLENIGIGANHFRDLPTALKATTLSTTATGTDTAASWPNARINRVAVQGNLFERLELGSDLDLSAARDESTGWLFANNTYNDCRTAALRFSAIEALEFYNNLLHNAHANVLLSLAPINPSLSNSISQWDYNLYWHPSYKAASGPAWLLDVGSARATERASLTAWQNAFSAQDQGDETANSYRPTQLAAAPDSHALFSEPLFVDASQADYTPQNPQLQSGGREGGVIGAFGAGQIPGAAAAP